ncbi:hypothetical protein Q7C36_001616 [Tachysurus vachellii]|uniref:Uncharacterized protein n=1 Tax=Tachysurus vachellii TaxID=175792 RepID=A0AA88NW34_TACVA|nr:uncharacterized protein si:dkey-192k22.2 [Tachysurus vachellii]KAK2865560.1 hypothetical protein Q7C36_001616 [Tachysurus vachellii]
MSNATIAKLTVLVFLAFIVCLPEFLPSEVLQVQFLCAPFDPCDPNSGRDQYDGQTHEVYDNAGITRPQCEAQNATNQDEEVKQWFVCETHADLRSLRDNTSVSEKSMEVIVTLQITAPSLTVNGNFNLSGLYVETQHNTVLFGCCIRNKSRRQNREKTPQSSSSAPGVFSAGPSDEKNENTRTHPPNKTHCFAHFKDIQRMFTTTVKHWSVSTIVWFSLMLMVVVLILLGVRDHFFKNRYCFKKKVKRVRPPARQQTTFSKRRVKSLGDLPDDVSVLSAEELFLEKTPSDYSRGHVTHQRRVSLASTKRFLNIFQESFKRGLSPIPELSMTDVSLGENEDGHDEELRSSSVRTEEESKVCLDVPLTPENTHSENFTFLHHRSHPSLESCH